MNKNTVKSSITSKTLKLKYTYNMMDFYKHICADHTIYIHLYIVDDTVTHEVLSNFAIMLLLFTLDLKGTKEELCTCNRFSGTPKLRHDLGDNRT